MQPCARLPSLGRLSSRIVPPSSCRRNASLDMTRSELIAEHAASNLHLRQREAELIVATVFDQISSALAHGQSVKVPAR